MNLPIPRSLDELTPTWLTSALTESGILKAANVQHIDSEILGTGSGFMGEIVRLTLTYDEIEPGAPESLIAKIPTPVAKNRVVSLMAGFYAREVEYYKDVSGKMNIRVPRCYYSAASKDRRSKDQHILKLEQRGKRPDWLMMVTYWASLFANRCSRKRFILLLEDLSHLQTGDQIKGGTMDQVHAALSTIAKVHAQFWDSAELKDMACAIPMVAEALLKQRSLKLLFLSPKAPIRDRFSPKTLGQIDWLTENSAALVHALGAESVTLLHGDLRLDNLFFGDKGAEPILFDWQVTATGAPGYDVAYFVSAVDLEQLGLDDASPVLDHYHAALMAQGVGNYSRERLQWEYEASLLLLLQIHAVAQQGFDPGDGRGVQLMDLWLQRLCTKLDSVECDTILAAGGETVPGTVSNH